MSQRQLTLQREILEQLKLFAPDGLPREWFEAAERVAKPPPSVKPQDASSPVVAKGPIKEAPPRVAPVRDTDVRGRMLELEAIRSVAEACTKCRLCETRNKVVFGVGNTDSPPIVFVGEGPGADEDRVGEPFVGKAGQLLTAALTKGMGLTREDVYICNVVKCRPPENRAPLPDEVASCNGYLFKQLELIQPQVIVTLGQPAQLALSGVNMGITKLRGQWQTWRGIKLMPTFHPAYILRNPSAKKEFWEDLQAVMAELGIRKTQTGGAEAAE